MDKTSSPPTPPMPTQVTRDVFFGKILECKVTVGRTAAMSVKRCKADKEFPMLITRESRQQLMIGMCVYGGILSA